MLNWIIAFFLLAVISAIFGFGGMAGTFASIAQFLAFIFAAFFVAGLIYSMLNDRRITPPF